MSTYSKRHRYLLGVGLIGILGMIASRYLPHTHTLVGEPAPELSHPALSGDPVDLSALKGEVIFLNFWATWCPSCIEELPHLDALQRRFRGRLSVVSVGGFREDAERLRSFLRRRPVTYPVVHLDESTLAQVVARFGQFYQIPQTFAIDKQGRIRHVWAERRDAEELTRVAQTLISEDER